MGYPYEDLDDSQFERLVVECMRELCGIAVQSFSAGPDGGRDAKFHGTCERFPSASEPWRGKTIGQAKHTHALSDHFSNPKFSGKSASSVLSGEIARIQKMVARREVDNYLLFSNRRLGAVASEMITRRIAAETGLDEQCVYLAGEEFLDSILASHPEVLTRANISPFDGPLLVSSKDLAEVILGIAQALSVAIPDVDAALVDRVSYQRKNEINAMSSAFAKKLSKLYLSLSTQIGQLLADPANTEILKLYEASAEDFQLKIVAHRRENQPFDHVFNHLVDVLFERDGVLASEKRLTRAVVFYMYWHCDIGEVPDAESE